MMAWLSASSPELAARCVASNGSSSKSASCGNGSGSAPIARIAWVCAWPAITVTRSPRLTRSSATASKGAM